MQFRLHEKNIPQIRACVNAYGEVWVHGDGNVFPIYQFNPATPHEQDHSQIHHDSFNKGQEEAGYRVKINKLNMPKSVMELQRLLEAAKTQEHLAKRQASMQNGNVRNVPVTDADFGPDFHEPEGEIDYQALYNKAVEQQVVQTPKPQVVQMPAEPAKAQASPNKAQKAAPKRATSGRKPTAK
jgi:hypothetical protein